MPFTLDSPTCRISKWRQRKEGKFLIGPFFRNVPLITPSARGSALVPMSPPPTRGAVQAVAVVGLPEVECGAARPLRDQAGAPHVAPTRARPVQPVVGVVVGGEEAEQRDVGHREAQDGAVHHVPLQVPAQLAVQEVDECVGVALEQLLPDRHLAGQGCGQGGHLPERVDAHQQGGQVGQQRLLRAGRALREQKSPQGLQRATGRVEGGECRSARVTSPPRAPSGTASASTSCPRTRSRGRSVPCRTPSSSAPCTRRARRQSALPSSRLAACKLLLVFGKIMRFCTRLLVVNFRSNRRHHPPTTMEHHPPTTICGAASSQ